MSLVLSIGLALLGAGLVLSHVVLFASRKPVREGRKMPRRQVVLMWLAVAMTVAGLALAGVPMLLGG